MAIHTDEQLEFILEKFAKVGREFGLIPGSGLPKGKIIELSKRRKLARRSTRRFFLGIKSWMRKLFLSKNDYV